MGVVVDTCIWVDVERKRLSHIDVADFIQNDAVYLTPPVIAELEYGVHRAATVGQRNKRLAALNKIKKKPCLIMDEQTGEIFGRLAADLDRQGNPARHRVNDLWIAALAIQNGFSVLTRNAKDFEDVAGLDVLCLSE
jgi:predicted nucleic acid-binding protein